MKYVVRFVAVILIVISGTAVASTDLFVGARVPKMRWSKYPPGTCRTHMLIEMETGVVSNDGRRMTTTTRR